MLRRLSASSHQPAFECNLGRRGIDSIFCLPCAGRIGAILITGTGQNCCGSDVLSNITGTGAK